MDTQDKRSNNIFTQRILPMSFFNGHTGQTVKQHMNSKNFAHVFFQWTDRTNGQTTYLFKVFCPCLFLMDTQDKQSNNIFIQSILPISFFNYTQDKRSNNILIQSLLPMSFLNGHMDKRWNNIFLQGILPMYFFNGYTGQTDKQHIYSKYFTRVFL